MFAEALGLGKHFTLRELDPDGGQHGAPVADVSARKWGFVAGAEGGAVGRGEPGSRAAMAVTLDEPVSEEVLHALEETPGFNEARSVTL